MEKPPKTSDASTREIGQGLVIVYRGELGGGLVLPPISRNKLAQQAIIEAAMVSDKNSR
jgi:hypothetical protein